MREHYFATHRLDRRIWIWLRIREAMDQEGFVPDETNEGLF